MPLPVVHEPMGQLAEVHQRFISGSYVFNNTMSNEFNSVSTKKLVILSEGQCHYF